MGADLVWRLLTGGGLMCCLGTAHASGPQDAAPPARGSMVFAHQEATVGAPDAITTNDGQTLHGTIISELQQGFLVRLEGGGTAVIPYARITAVERGDDTLLAGLPKLGQAQSTAQSTALGKAPPPELPLRVELLAQAQNSKTFSSGSKSVPLAYLLEVLFPGAGLIYAGSVGEGVGHLLLVTLLPVVLTAALGGTVATLYALVRDDRALQLGLGLGINLIIILSAAVVSARVTAILRAGPAAANTNQKLLGDLVRQARKEAWLRAASGMPEPPPETQEEEPGDDAEDPAP